MDPISIALMLASKFAPDIIKHFTNSDTAADVATKVIDIAKTVTGKDDAQAASDAIQADPALALQFKTAVMANETELEKAYLSDTQNARARDIEFTKSGISNRRANVLAGFATFLVIICLSVVVWNSAMDDFAKATITLVLGRAFGWVEQIFSFEFGTTRTNRTKDDTINNLSK